MARKITIRPLVYSCSGCSCAAQMVNALAVRLDREEVADAFDQCGILWCIGEARKESTALMESLFES